MLKKLNQDDVISFSINVRSDPSRIGEALIGWFPKKIGNIIFAITKGCGDMAAQTDADNYDQEKGPFHTVILHLCMNSL
jgi:hypothetical protein